MFEFYPRAAVSTKPTANLGCLGIIEDSNLITILKKSVDDYCPKSVFLSSLGNMKKGTRYIASINNDGSSDVDTEKLLESNGDGTYSEIPVSEGDCVYVTAHRMYYFKDDSVNYPLSFSGSWIPMLRFAGEVDAIHSSISQVTGKPEGYRFIVSTVTNTVVDLGIGVVTKAYNDNSEDASYLSTAFLPPFSVVYCLSDGNHYIHGRKKDSSMMWHIMGTSGYAWKPFQNITSGDQWGVEYSLPVYRGSFRSLSDACLAANNRFPGKISYIYPASSSYGDSLILDLNPNIGNNCDEDDDILIYQLSGSSEIGETSVVGRRNVYYASSTSTSPDLCLVHSFEDGAEPSDFPVCGSQHSPVFPLQTPFFQLHFLQEREDRYLIGEIDYSGKDLSADSSVMLTIQSDANVVNHAFDTGFLAITSSVADFWENSVWESSFPGENLASLPFKFSIGWRMEQYFNENSSTYFEDYSEEGAAFFNFALTDISTNTQPVPVPSMTAPSLAGVSYSRNTSQNDTEESQDYLISELFYMSNSTLEVYETFGTLR